MSMVGNEASCRNDQENPPGIETLVLNLYLKHVQLCRNDQENPPGIETLLLRPDNHTRVATVATTKKTRQGLKLL